MHFLLIISSLKPTTDLSRTYCHLQLKTPENVVRQPATRPIAASRHRPAQLQPPHRVPRLGGPRRRGARGGGGPRRGGCGPRPALHGEENNGVRPQVRHGELGREQVLVLHRRADPRLTPSGEGQWRRCIGIGPEPGPSPRSPGDRADRPAFSSQCAS